MNWTMTFIAALPLFGRSSETFLSLAMAGIATANIKVSRTACPTLSLRLWGSRLIIRPFILFPEGAGKQDGSQHIVQCTRCAKGLARKWLIGNVTDLGIWDDCDKLTQVEPPEPGP